MSSIVTAVPSGVLQDWCVQVPWFGYPPEPQQCANSTRGTQESDYETICCDGNIIDTNQNIFHGGQINMQDLVCCRLVGPQAGGLQPLPAGQPTTCDSGSAVPLTSLAATNTQNAQDFLVTYTSASFGGPTPGDFIPTVTPYCLWAYTKSGVVMETVTVPAPQITTLSSSSYGSVYMASDSPSSSDRLSNSETLSASVSSTQTTRDSPSSATAQSSATSSTTSSGSTIGSGQFLVMLCGLVVGLWGHFY